MTDRDGGRGGASRVKSGDAAGTSGWIADTRASSLKTDTRASSRGAKLSVLVVVVLGLFALYVAFGGPLPFLVEGGPSLDSVPGEADVVVYTDAWTFSSDTSTEVVDGILTVTNESLPGYSGPASLGTAFEELQETTLDPNRLRSVTAFGSYDENGRVGQYQALILKTSWNRNEILDSFGGGRDTYEKRSHAGTTVFVSQNESTILPVVARLEGDQFVVGTEQAVTDAIDAHEGRTDGMNATLRSRFESLQHGPVRFVAAMPSEVPGEPFVSRNVSDAIGGIETVGGVYSTNPNGATVRLTLGTVDADHATAVEPSLRASVDYARRYVPEQTKAMLTDASVSRSGSSVTVTMSGSVESFVGGYRALVGTGLVNLLVGDPIGEPSLKLVPRDVAAIGYADGGMVADPTTRTLFERLLTARGTSESPAVEGVLDGVETFTAPELTTFRSVTVFGQDLRANATTAETAAIIQANWSRADAVTALDAANVTYRSDSYAGQPVFVVEEQPRAIWIAPLDGPYLVIGTIESVRAVIDVSSGDRPAVSGQLKGAMDGLPNGYVRAASTVPRSVAGDDGRVSSVLGDVDVIAASYDADGNRISGRLELHFRTTEKATNNAQLLAVLVTVAGQSVEESRLRDLVGAVEIDREGRVVALTAETAPETLLWIVDWLLESGPFDQVAANTAASSSSDRHRFDGWQPTGRYIP